MRTLILENSKEMALIDDEDFEEVNSYKWWVIGDVRHYGIRGLVCKQKIMLSHFILKIHEVIVDEEVDHKDLNWLNFQKNNLREASRSENMANRPKQRGVYSSKYKGVNWHKRDGVWRAIIKINNYPTEIGRFHSEVEAAKAYDKRAKKLFGEFAFLNFR